MASPNSVNPKLEFFSDNQRHLICVPFSIENLHQMARELNINACWFHNGKFPHYDIPKKRISEIQDKTQVISSKALLLIIKSGE